MNEMINLLGLCNVNIDAAIPLKDTSDHLLP